MIHSTNLHNYTCILYPEPAKVDIFEPSNTTIFAHLGSPVTLRCDSTEPNSQVTWSVPANVACLFGNTNGSYLNVSSMQPAQAGNYTCTLTNKLGTATKSFVIDTDGRSQYSSPLTRNPLIRNLRL